MNFPKFLSRSSGLKKRGFIGPYTCLLAGAVASTGCSMQVSDPAVDPRPLSALSWSPPTVGIDAGSGFALTPRIAVEPDPADNDLGGPDDNASGAIAVWVERKDIDPSDLKPAVYHLYAKRAVGGVWEATDPNCPFGFPFDILDDGVCLIDNASPDSDAIGARVVMDALGNAVVVWQEFSGPANRSRIYARRYVVGTGWEAGTTAIDAPTMGSAVGPDVSMEPDGGGTAIATWTQYWSDADTSDWLQYYDGPEESILSLTSFNGILYAGQGGADPGDGIVLRGDVTPMANSYSVAAVGETIEALEWYGGQLYAGQGNSAGKGDIIVCEPAFSGNFTRCEEADWRIALDGTEEAFLSFARFNGRFYAGQGTDPGDGDIYVCEPERHGTNDDKVPPALTFRTCINNGVGNDWILAYEGLTDGRERVESLAVFNGHLYAGFGSAGSGTGAGDILLCIPITVAPGYECNPGDWVSAYDGGEEAILSLAVYKGRLYAGQGNDTGDGDILVCDPTLNGDPVRCDDQNDWSVFYDGAEEAIEALKAHEGFLFAGQGNGVDQGNGTDNGKVLRFDESTIFTSFNGGQESIHSLAVSLDEIYAGQGSDLTDGNVYSYKSNVGWHGMTRRFVVVPAPGWAATDADTGCSPGANNPDDGICEPDPSKNEIAGPKIAMDNAGLGTHAYIRFDPVYCPQSGPGTGYTGRDCTVDASCERDNANGESYTDLDGDGLFFPGEPFTDLNTNGSYDLGEPFVDWNGDTIRNPSEPFIDTNGNGLFDPVGFIPATCHVGRIYATRFDLASWAVPQNLTPVQTFIGTTDVRGTVNENCEDIGDGVGFQPETASGSSACLYVSELQLAMDSQVNPSGGNAVLTYKTFERASLTNADGGPNPAQLPPLDALDVEIQKAVRFVRFDGAGGTWGGIQTLAGYSYNPDLNNTLVSECASVNASDTEDYVVVMNCEFRGLTVGTKPDDGNRAMVAYERYDGTNHDIVVHRYNGASIGTIPDPDNCANTLATCWHNVDNGTGESRAPSLGMDNRGNAVLLWVEEDPSGRWRVYANRCAENAGDCIWNGPVPIDSGVGGEYYFEPRVAMEALNAGNASALDCGGTGGATCGDAFSVYNVLNGFLNFRIDAARWSPP